MNFLTVVPRIKQLRKTQIFLPVANMINEMTAFLAGEDLALRSSVIAPGAFDRELNASLFSHSYFYDIETKKSIDAMHKGTDAQRFQGFTDNISSIDRKCMMWAFHKATYGTIDKNRKITCRNEDCRKVEKWNITPDDLIHEDTFTPWDKEVSFKEYVEPIIIDYDDIVFEFRAHIPSITHYNKVISSMSIKDLQNNYDKLNVTFARPESVVLNVKSIKVSSKTNAFPSVETSDLKELLIFANDGLPQDVMDTFFDLHDKAFEKYLPKFYYNVTCPKCQHQFKVDIDPDTEFTRRLFQPRATSSDTSSEISVNSEELGLADNPEPENTSGATTSFIKA